MLSYGWRDDLLTRSSRQPDDQQAGSASPSRGWSTGRDPSRAAHGKYAAPARPRPLRWSLTGSVPRPASRTTPARRSSARSRTAAPGDPGCALLVAGTGIGTAAVIDGHASPRASRPRRDPRRPHHPRPRGRAVPVRQHRLRRGPGRHLEPAAAGDRPGPSCLPCAAIGIQDLVETETRPSRRPSIELDDPLRGSNPVPRVRPRRRGLSGGVMRSPAARHCGSRATCTDLWSSSSRRHSSSLPTTPDLGPSRTGSTRPTSHSEGRP